MADPTQVLVKALERKADLNIIEYLFKDNIDVKYVNPNGQNLLFLGNYSVPVVEFLISKGVDPLHKDKNGKNLLFVSNDDVICYLLDNTKIDVNSVDNEGNITDCKTLQEDTLKKCICKGLDINHVNKKGDKLITKFTTFVILSMMIRNGYDPNSKDSMGTPLLFYYLNHKNRNCLELLLNHGADINARDYKQKGAIHYATSASTVEFLLNNNIKLKSNVDYTALKKFATPEIIRQAAISNPNFVFDHIDLLDSVFNRIGFTISFVENIREDLLIKYAKYSAIDKNNMAILFSFTESMLKYCAEFLGIELESYVKNAYQIPDKEAAKIFLNDFERNKFLQNKAITKERAEIFGILNNDTFNCVSCNGAMIITGSVATRCCPNIPFMHTECETMIAKRQNPTCKKCQKTYTSLVSTSYKFAGNTFIETFNNGCVRHRAIGKCFHVSNLTGNGNSTRSLAEYTQDYDNRKVLVLDCTSSNKSFTNQAAFFTDSIYTIIRFDKERSSIKISLENNLFKNNMVMIKNNHGFVTYVTPIENSINIETYRYPFRIVITETNVTIPSTYSEDITEVYFYL